MTKTLTAKPLTAANSRTMRIAKRTFNKLVYAKCLEIGKAGDERLVLDYLQTLSTRPVAEHLEYFADRFGIN